MFRYQISLRTNLICQLRRRLYTTTQSATPNVEFAEPPEPLYQSVPTCPPPTCPCVATPEGLDIEREKPMTIPPYSRHVVIKTGRDDWASRIEDEESSVLGDVEEGKPRANLAKSLKALIGPGGKYYNPNRNVLITNSSLRTSTKAPNGNDVYVYPSSLYIQNLKNTPEVHERFVRHFLMGRDERAQFDREEALVNKNVEFYQGQADVKASSSEKFNTSPGSIRSQIKYCMSDTPAILICSHKSRDSRCGVLGPILKKAFSDYIISQRYRYMQRKAADGEIVFSMKNDGPINTSREYPGVLVSSISHVGGHAWAGNVIVYIPPQYSLKNGTKSPLAGKGVWYGRVEPKHVEGIVEETIRGGRIIKDILRGVHAKPRKMGSPDEVLKDRSIDLLDG